VLDARAAPISGDPGRLQQVVWNLLSNAVKFTNRGGRVQVRVERANSHVAIVVSDTGIGIAKEFLPHMFERFRQADAGTTRARGGLGLGLGIARQLVELHGGTIQAASAGEGHGATFRVELPLMIVEPEAHVGARVHPLTERSVASMLIPDLQGVTVLAVDDDRDALQLVREILESTGARVSTAHSAAEALELLASLRPDALVADLGMPGMDGFQLIATVRRHPDAAVRRVPAAALTAFARSEDRARALRSGFNIHIAKPADPAELMAAIAALIRHMNADPQA
jgi:CheY-like chemotaxis protein